MEKEEVTVEDAKEHGLREEEFELIKKILGRIPNSTELGIFSGMWSEHCSYKNSILKLKTLPTESELLLTTTGEENAGALDIGDNLGIVFKIESHNHPTAVEPYQGAATGVGGIMRDIFTMGARPFISLNSLRFGYPENKRNSYLLRRAVKGIADYGNSLGIAVSGGELFFDSSFTKNPLVNAMTVGVVNKNKMAKATTGGAIGNSVFIVGATTGRDGIHGASFASKDLTKESEEKRSAVQVGDPFMEKLLMEATLEAIDKDLLVGIQDMGAAGISCSTSEMSAKGKTGMEIDLDLVPFRETGMNAYEAMLSESQERMLVVPKKGKENELVAIFKKWDLNAVEIGKVTEGNSLKIFKEGKLKAEIPAESLVLGGGAPRYKRDEKRPLYLDEVRILDEANIPDIRNTIDKVIQLLLSSLNICSRKPLYEQYDTDVGLVEVIGPGLDGGLARVPNTNKGVAVSTDCNSRYTYLDPYQGAIFAVAESARNVLVTGAKPIGITNNLNFANPYIPENYYVFSECVKGIGDACRFLKLPVTGGNVSFYNESPEGPVFPTPTIGMVGLLDNLENRIYNYFKEANLEIALVGKFRPSLGGSEYLYKVHSTTKGKIPELDLEDEKNLIHCILELNQNRFIESAKDLSLGGLLIACLKQSFEKKIGFSINTNSLNQNRLDKVYFGETASSVLITYKKEFKTQIEKLVSSNKLDFHFLGVTTQNYNMKFDTFEFQLNELEKYYYSPLESVFAE
jgi:phosphoribosylformylglycinamidine synthase